jgi:L-amino acid N-acyltransferase YncA
VKDKYLIAGWIALSVISGRCVHAGVAEVSIYIRDEFREQSSAFVWLDTGTRLVK